MSEKFLVDILTPKQKKIFLFLFFLWLINLAWFWIWWLQSSHIIQWLGIIINSLFLAWNTILPLYYFYFVMRMKKPNPKLEFPSDWRVAMIVTKAPSEPWEMVKQTLKAMAHQSYPHDTWLADEDPQPDVINWCHEHNVKISSRKGVTEYHRNNWPRRTKCKEGNLAYFYDHFGYDNYDFVVQMDADHIPDKGYLEAMLRGFFDSQVGYVAAPSICDANLNTSWSVRARLFAEATMHGSLQAGYNSNNAPLCIGSHYAVRTIALKEIGGLGPELAEDHTTTLMMNAAGWRGVFAIDAIAHGDGPTSFYDCMIQEFQWARSLTQVFLSITPKYLSKLKPHLQFQFLFAQLWYPIFGISNLIGILLPILALIIDTPWVNVNYLEFIGRSFILSISCLLPIIWIRKCGYLRPVKAKIICQETILFQIARSAWILLGVINGIISFVLKKDLIFKVTPKGKYQFKPLPLKIILPYLFLALLTSITVILAHNVKEAQGYYFLCLLNSAMYLILTIAIVNLHIREHQIIKREKLQSYMAIGLVSIIFLYASILRLPQGLKTIILPNYYEKFWHQKS